jgi:hypothetical protein
MSSCNDPYQNENRHVIIANFFLKEQFSFPNSFSNFGEEELCEKGLCDQFNNFIYSLYRRLSESRSKLSKEGYWKKFHN